LVENTKSRIRIIEWEEYSELCRLLAVKIKKLHNTQTVVGIAHGGVIVGATVATILGRDFFPIKFSRRVNSKVVRKKSKLLVPPTADLKDNVVLLVDDATQTGDTMLSAIEAIKKHQPAQIITAVLVRRGDFEADYMGSFFKGPVQFPWQVEMGLEIDEKTGKPVKK
jgi:uncharacterized protein